MALRRTLLFVVVGSSNFSLIYSLYFQFFSTDFLIGSSCNVKIVKVVPFLLAGKRNRV